MASTCFTWSISGTTWLLIGPTTASEQTVDAELLMRWRRLFIVEAA
ncbi:hypothetical protein [Cellulosimicrobium cellulans]|nr:hypothetical protein [Cellulosimicrobium cellulans]MBE9937600.1 hypothetical protein [Cellulosimicrobium cellulans]